MSGYGMEDTDLVYNQGSRIHGLGDDGGACGLGVAQRVFDAAGKVHHHLLVGPLETIAQDCVDDANSLRYAIENAGSGIAGSSNVVVDAENEQTAAHVTYASSAEGTQSELRRSI